MNRRDALKRTALLMGGTISASTLALFIEGCNLKDRKGEKVESDFSKKEYELVSKISEIIIPRTDTPGAVDVGVPDFIVMMLTDCYLEKERETFKEGLSHFDHYCETHFDKDFLHLSEEDQILAVAQMDEMVLGKGGKKSEGSFGNHATELKEDEQGAEAMDWEKQKEKFKFYRLFKELTLLGFFTSEEGATEVLRYVQIPGRDEGCIPYQEGDRAWATA